MTGATKAQIEAAAITRYNRMTTSPTNGIQKHTWDEMPETWQESWFEAHCSLAGDLVPPTHRIIALEDLETLRTALCICDLIIDHKPDLLARIDALIAGDGGEETT